MWVLHCNTNQYILSVIDVKLIFILHSIILIDMHIAIAYYIYAIHSTYMRSIRFFLRGIVGNAINRTQSVTFPFLFIQETYDIMWVCADPKRENVFM